jgi:ABC-type sugar transport system substrate-binding protein
MKIKNLFMLLFVVLVAASLVVTAGGRKKEAPEKEKAAEVEMEADGDEIDPWIIEMRKGLDPYRGDITYKGEYGATPTWDTDLVLTVNEVKRVRATKSKVGYVMDAAAGDYTTSQLKGMEDVFEHLGIDFIGQVDPQFDPAKEKAGVEDLLTMGADIIIGAPIDAVASAESFRAVGDAGKKLVIWSNIPNGYEYGRDYVGVASAMAEDLGKFTVKIMAEGITKRTEVAYFYFDASFWVVNLIDAQVKKAIEEHPYLEIVEELGFSAEAEAFDLMSAAIQRHPNIKRVYGNWMTPASFAADACVQMNRDDIKIGTFGIDSPTLVNILTGGNIIGTISDDPYHIGANLALLCGYAAIDKKAPEFTITPALPMTKDNIEEIWEIANKIPIPESVKKVLGK